MIAKMANRAEGVLLPGLKTMAFYDRNVARARRVSAN
jgi:hypothetical protein